MALSEQHQPKQPALEIVKMGNTATYPLVTDQWHPHPKIAQPDPSDGLSRLLRPEVLINKMVATGGKYLGLIKRL
jgi:hypothetical protein